MFSLERLRSVVLLAGLIGILSVNFAGILTVSGSSHGSGLEIGAAAEHAPLERKHVTRHPFARGISQRQLLSCQEPSPYVKITVDAVGNLADVQEVTVTVTGVVNPSDDDWIAVVSPSSSNYANCPAVEGLYLETGDTSPLPLLCHSPVKFATVSKVDPEYLSCRKSQCQNFTSAGSCSIKTCSGSATFRLINIRTDVKFLFLAGGFELPCILKTSPSYQFANPNSPLYGHLAAIDSAVTSIRLTWVSGTNQPQEVRYANGLRAGSVVSTFAQTDMCDSLISPAKDFGWHDPGFIHSAVMTGISPSTSYSYTYGSDAVGWSNPTTLFTPPAAGADELTFIAYGDMGKKERDGSSEHFIQPGALSTLSAVEAEVRARRVDMILHVGDISYATGFLVEWDAFLEMAGPVFSQVPYMTAIGNHERDFPKSGSLYDSPDSGGECGVPYEAYFQMPLRKKDKPWYSIEHGPVHFTVMSTEHAWTGGSEQYQWIISDFASVDRTRTPWLIIAGHRPMYSSIQEDLIGGVLPTVNPDFRPALEPLLLASQVDLAMWGHAHNYERTCAVNQSTCLLDPSKDSLGIDTYNGNGYRAPVHLVTGTAGFDLNAFKQSPSAWSKVQISEFGYTKIQASRTQLAVKFILSASGAVADQFIMLKS